MTETPRQRAERRLYRVRLLSVARRVRSPLLLAAVAVAILIVLNSFTIEAAFVGPAEIAARILAVLAFGWAILNVGDWFWSRRLGRLQLDVADNLKAREIATRLKVLRRIWAVLVVTLTIGAALTAIPWARQIGVSIFASAGIAGIAVGIAAQPVLSNLIAGLQIAFTQPMRLEDTVVVEGEFGWIEEIGMFHVVVRLWDLRRLIVPLRHFIDSPFQNWTHRSASIIGAVFWRLDYRAPVQAMREKLNEFVKESPLWDGKVIALQVTDTDDRSIEVRALASARNAGDAFDLRCLVREKMIAWLQQEAPEALPRTRAEAAVAGGESEGDPLSLGVRVPPGASAVAAEDVQPDRDPSLDNPNQSPEQRG